MELKWSNDKFVLKSGDSQVSKIKLTGRWESHSAQESMDTRIEILPLGHKLVVIPEFPFPGPREEGLR